MPSLTHVPPLPLQPAANLAASQILSLQNSGTNNNTPFYARQLYARQASYLVDGCCSISSSISGTCSSLPRSNVQCSSSTAMIVANSVRKQGRATNASAKQKLHDPHPHHHLFRPFLPTSGPSRTTLEIENSADLEGSAWPSGPSGHNNGARTNRPGAHRHWTHYVPSSAGGNMLAQPQDTPVSASYNNRRPQAHPKWEKDNPSPTQQQLMPPEQKPGVLLTPGLHGLHPTQQWSP
jgi:hypothetical protein